jgi:hypothetical protein
MESICSALLARELVSLDALDAALEWQMLHGWDVATSLLALGSLKEGAVLRLLSDFHELPIGPKGRLPELSDEILALVPPSVMLRLNVYPYKRTSRSLHLAVSAPLSAEVELELRELAELQLRPAIVPAVRLVEALAAFCGGPRPPALEVALERLPADAPSIRGSARGAGAPYRRMSEAPDGVRVSRQQAAGAAFGPLTRPVQTEGPAPDSQGNWLDRLGDDGVVGHAEPLEMPSTIPPSAASSPRESGSSTASSEPAVSSRANPWLADLVEGATLPPTPRSVTSSTEALPAPSPTRRSFVATVPAPGAATGSTTTTREGLASDAPAPPKPSVAFRHRGPLPAREALAFARKAEDVDVVLQVLARFTRQYVERLLVFAVEGESAEVRLAHGVGGAAPSLLVRLDDDGLLARALQSGDPVLAPLGTSPSDRAVARVLPSVAAAPSVAMAVPLTLRGEVVVILYGDDLDEPVSLEAATAVAELGSLAVEEMARIVLSPTP